MWKKTWLYWKEHDVQTQAAAISFYAALSLAPLVLLFLGVFNLLFGEETLALLLVAEEALGTYGAQLVQQFLGLVQSSSHVLTLFGFVTLLFGSARVFMQLRKALNTIWEVGKPGGIREIARSFATGIVMVLGMVGLVILSLVATVVVSSLAQLVPSFSFFWFVLSVLLSLLLFTAGFALMFRFVPNCEPAWKDVWKGAAVAAVLVETGNVVISIFISVVKSASFYGVAGTLILLMLWIYYACLMILFGASYTRVLGMTRKAGKSRL